MDEENCEPSNCNLVRHIVSLMSKKGSHFSKFISKRTQEQALKDQLSAALRRRRSQSWAESGMSSRPTVSGIVHMGGCQNYGPFWGTLNIRCRIITGSQKGTIILTSTHIFVPSLLRCSSVIKSGRDQLIHPWQTESFAEVFNCG